MTGYPYNSAQVLTDDLYTMYYEEGQTKGSEEQRNAAFFVAEKLASSHYRTFLKETIVTGTYLWPQLDRHIRLHHGHVKRVHNVTILSAESGCNCDITEDTGCAFVLDADYGYLHIRQTREGFLSGCGCSVENFPYQARVVYEAGLSSGTVYQDDILLGLATIADILLNEMADPGGNESPGDIGVQAWGAQGYSETRVPLRKTVIGSSPRANFAAGLLDQAVPTRRLLRL